MTEDTKQTSSELSADEARDLIENAHCGLVITDQDGAISFSNRRFQALTEQSADDLAKLGLRDLLDTASKIYFDTHILPMIMLQGYAREIMCRLETPAGDRIPILLNAGFRRATQHRSARIEFTIFDATERSMYEADLRKARDDAEEFAAIVRSATVAILRVDEQGRVSRWNSAAEQLFGFSVDQAQGADVSDLIQIEGEPDWVQALIKGAVGEYGAASERRIDKVSTKGMNLDISFSRIPFSTQADGTDHYSLILRDVTQRVTNERRLRVVMQELNHRVKNTLAVVNSIARRTFVSPGMKGEKQQFEERLQALARAHDMLVKNNWDSANLREIIEVSAKNSGHEAAFVLDGPDIRFPPASITMLSMALFELTTNAIKHGALATPEGRVHLKWGLSNDAPPTFTLNWVETGGGLVVKPTRQGFGSQMLQRLVTAELNGEAELDYDPQGLHYRLTAPYHV